MATWIGEEPYDSDFVVDFIRNIHSYSTRSESPEQRANAKNTLHAFSALLDRPHQRCVWVIQEIGLSRSTTLHWDVETFFGSR